MYDCYDKDPDPSNSYGTGSSMIYRDGDAKYLANLNTGFTTTASMGGDYMTDDNNMYYQQQRPEYTQYAYMSDTYADTDAEKFDYMVDGGDDLELLDDGGYENQWNDVHNGGRYMSVDGDGLGGGDLNGPAKMLPNVPIKPSNSMLDGMYSFSYSRQRYGASLPTTPPVVAQMKNRLLPQGVPHADTSATTIAENCGSGSIMNGKSTVGNYSYQQQQWNNGRYYNGMDAGGVRVTNKMCAPTAPLRILPGIQHAQYKIQQQDAFKDNRMDGAVTSSHTITNRKYNFSSSCNSNMNSNINDMQYDNVNNAAASDNICDLSYSTIPSCRTIVSDQDPYQYPMQQRPHTSMAPYSDYTGSNYFGYDSDLSAIDNMSTYSDTPARSRSSLQQKYLQQQQQQQRQQSLIKAMSVASVIASGETRRIAATPQTSLITTKDNGTEKTSQIAKNAAFTRSYAYAFEYDSSGVAAPKYELFDTTDVEGITDAKLNNSNAIHSKRKNSITGTLNASMTISSSTTTTTTTIAPSTAVTSMPYDWMSTRIETISPRPVARKLPKRLPTPKYKNTIEATSLSSSIPSTMLSSITTTTTTIAKATITATTTSTSTITISSNVYTSSCSGITSMMKVNTKQLPKLPEPTTITTPLTNDFKLENTLVGNRKLSFCENVSNIDQYVAANATANAESLTSTSLSPVTTFTSLGCVPTSAYSMPLTLQSIVTTTITTTTTTTTSDAISSAITTPTQPTAATTASSPLSSNVYNTAWRDNLDSSTTSHFNTASTASILDTITSTNAISYNYDLSNNNIKYGSLSTEYSNIGKSSEKHAGLTTTTTTTTTTASTTSPTTATPIKKDSPSSRTFDINDYLNPYTWPAYTYEPLPSITTSLPSTQSIEPTTIPQPIAIYDQCPTEMSGANNSGTTWAITSTTTISSPLPATSFDLAKLTATSSPISLTTTMATSAIPTVCDYTSNNTFSKNEPILSSVESTMESYSTKNTEIPLLPTSNSFAATSFSKSSSQITSPDEKSQLNTDTVKTSGESTASRLAFSDEKTALSSMAPSYAKATSYLNTFDYNNLYSTLENCPLSITTTTNATEVTTSSTSDVAASSSSTILSEMPKRLFTTTTHTSPSLSPESTNHIIQPDFTTSTTFSNGETTYTALDKSKITTTTTTTTLLDHESDNKITSTPPSIDLPSYISDYLNMDYTNYMNDFTYGITAQSIETATSASETVVEKDDGIDEKSLTTTTSAMFDDDFYDSYKVDFSSYGFMKEDAPAKSQYVTATATESTPTTTTTTILSEMPPCEATTNNYNFEKPIEPYKIETETVTTTASNASASNANISDEFSGFYKPVTISSSSSSSLSSSLSTTLSSSTKKLSTSVAGKTASNMLGGFSKGIKGGLDGVLSGVSSTVSATDDSTQNQNSQPAKKGFGFGLASKFVPNVGGLLAGTTPTNQKFQQPEQKIAEPIEPQPFGGNDIYSSVNDYGPVKMGTTTTANVYDRKEDYYKTTNAQSTTNTQSHNEFLLYDQQEPYVDRMYDSEPMVNTNLDVNSLTTTTATPTSTTSSAKKTTSSLLSSLSGKPPTTAPTGSGAASSSVGGGVFGSFLGKAAAVVQSATQVVNQSATKAATVVSQKVPSTSVMTTGSQLETTAASAINANVNNYITPHDIIFNSNEQNEMRHVQDVGYIDNGVDYKNSNLQYVEDAAATHQYNANHYYSNDNQNQLSDMQQPQQLSNIGKMLPTVPPARSTGKKLPTINGKSIGYLMKQQTTEIYDDDIVNLDDVRRHIDGDVVGGNIVNGNERNLIGMNTSSYSIDSEQDDYYMDPQQTTPSTSAIANRLSSSKGNSCYYEQSTDVGLGGGYDYREDYFDEEDEYKYLENEEIEEYEHNQNQSNSRTKPKLLSTLSNQKQSSTLDYIDEVNDDNFLEENYPSEDSGNYLDESSSGSIGVIGTMVSSPSHADPPAIPPNDAPITTIPSVTLKPTPAESVSPSSLNIHQHIKKQDSIILEEDEDEDFNDIGVGRRSGSFKAGPISISRRSSQELLEDGVGEDDDDMPELSTHNIIEATKKKKILTRGETEEVVSGHMHILRKADVTAKQRWHWAYNKIIMQLNVSIFLYISSK